MKGLFIPEITAEMFKNGCLESIEQLMAEGEIYDIDYPLEQKSKTGHWVYRNGIRYCEFCGASNSTAYASYCPNCGAEMESEE